MTAIVSIIDGFRRPAGKREEACRARPGVVDRRRGLSKFVSDDPANRRSDPARVALSQKQLKSIARAAQLFVARRLCFYSALS